MTYNSVEYGIIQCDHLVVHSSYKAIDKKIFQDWT